MKKLLVIVLLFIGVVAHSQITMRDMRTKQIGVKINTSELTAYTSAMYKAFNTNRAVQFLATAPVPIELIMTPYERAIYFDSKNRSSFKARYYPFPKVYENLETQEQIKFDNVSYVSLIRINDSSQYTNTQLRRLVNGSVVLVTVKMRPFKVTIRFPDGGTWAKDCLVPANHDSSYAASRYRFLADMDIYYTEKLGADLTEGIDYFIIDWD